VTATIRNDTRSHNTKIIEEANTENEVWNIVNEITITPARNETNFERGVRNNH
jgi:hypothetical protein